MKRFEYATAINQLKLEKKQIVNKNLCSIDKLPLFARLKNFYEMFLPYLTIVADSREQDTWVTQYATHYGIKVELAKKDTKLGTENLKEGDYTFKVSFGNNEYDFTGVVSYERKGKISEFYNNCLSDRKRVKREFERFGQKMYDKVVLLLQFGEKLEDLINLQFSYYGKENGERKLFTKNTHYTMYSTIMSWKQPNNNDFDIIQSENKTKLFWLMVVDMYYYFRNVIRNESISKGLVEELE